MAARTSMNQTQKPKRKTGRPPKFPGQGVRASHSLRVRGPIDEALRIAAAVSNRTIAEELEYRINQSFEGLYLNIDQQKKEYIFDRARSNQRSVEDEILSTMFSVDSFANDLRDLSSKQFSEFVRVVVRGVALKIMEREAVTYNHEIKDLSFEYRPEEDQKLVLREEIYDYFSRVMKWSQLAEQYAIMLADVIDPDKRHDDDNRMKEYILNILKHEDGIRYSNKARGVDPSG